MICAFTKVKAKYYSGSVISVKKTNIAYLEPHRVLFTSKTKELIILIYDGNEDIVYLYNPSSPCTYNKLQNILKNIDKS